jgi:hypothetical protein
MVASVGLVDAREDLFDACLCHLVELMCKAHHAKVGKEVSVIVRRVVTVDAGEERGIVSM